LEFISELNSNDVMLSCWFVILSSSNCC